MHHGPARLAGIGHFGFDEIAETAGDAIGDRAHQVGPIIAHGDAADHPRAACPSRPGARIARRGSSRLLWPDRLVLT